MDQKKLNKCIAMALLRQCALVWEHCMAFSNPVVECTLNFSDIRKCMGKDGHKTETGLIHTFVDYNQLWYANRENPIEGVTIDVKYESVWIEMENFKCYYPLENVFNIAFAFCQCNGCQSLLNKTTFCLKDGKRYAVLPEVKTKVKKTSGKREKSCAEREQPRPKVNTSGALAEMTIEDRLRAAIRKQLRMSA